MTEQQANDGYQYLIPVDDYLKAGIHIGTKFKTESMKPFIYKIRPDGLAVMDVQKIDERIRAAINLMGQFAPEDIIIACRRENGWKALKKFTELTDIRGFPGRYPPGILTNTQLETFTEAKLILVTDPFPDRNAIKDALRVGIPVIALCDTNNKIKDLDLAVPCNNKGKKSLGLMFWTVARGYLKARGKINSDLDFKAKVEDFAPE
jgi:small subunit ribosomal protein S2